MPVGRWVIRTGRVGLVDVLAARARRPVGVDLQVVRVDRDVRRVLDHRGDLEPGERRLAAVGRVERRQADEPVHALLRAEEAVGVLARRAERRGLDAGLLPRAGLEQVDLEAALLGPAHLHPQHHLRPVLGVRAARAGVDGDERVAAVVLAREQALLLELDEALLEGRELVVELGRDVGVLGEQLGERVELLDPRLEVAERLHPPRDRLVLHPEPGRLALVVVEAGVGHLLLEVGDARLELLGLQERAQARELLAQRVEPLGDGLGDGRGSHAEESRSP
jgi:hypothetical protein